MSSSGIFMRRRDRLFGRFRRRPASPSSGSSVPSGSTSPPTNNGFLHEALQKLTEQERLVIREQITSDISTTIQAAHDAAERQKSVCQQQRWSGSEKADKVLLWLDRFKSVGDIIANVDPVHVGLPWAGIRMLLEVAVADSRQMRALVSGMDLALCMANRLQAYLSYYHHLPPAQTTDNLREALILLYTHVLRFLAKAFQIYLKNAATRKAQALWQNPDLTSFESECDTLAGRAEIEANNCDREQSARQRVLAAHWKEDLATKLQQLDSIRSIESSLVGLRVKVDLSQLVRVEEATYNSTVESKLSRCLNGTRLQILHNIAQWAEKPDGKPIFWLCGQAGTGKSTISRTVAQEFDSQGYLGASFFFKRTEKNRRSADHFFSTITAQLADMIPHLQAPVAAALDKDSFLCGRGIQEQFERLLLHPLLSVNPAYLPQGRVVVVIDGLDECDNDTNIRIFLGLLTQIRAKSALRLCIFLTSRPELPIRLGFQQLDYNLHQDIVLEQVQEATIHGDIRAYFDNEFLKIREEQLLKHSDSPLSVDWPNESDRQALVDLAVPLFIFATTVCRFMSENPPKRLGLILEQRYSAGSSHLAKLYLPILNQLLDEKETEEQLETLKDFREVVGPIVLAADPLSIASLARLLCLDRAEIELRLERLHSVLQVPVKLCGPVRLLHLSFRDFLIDPKRKDKSDFWISETDTHTKLARDCLRRLEHTTLHNDICCVLRPGTRRTEYPAQHVATYIPPDVAYACSYWPLHFIKSGERLFDDSPVHHFLQQHFLHWLEALSWLGKLSSVIAYIHDLTSIAQVRGSLVAPTSETNGIAQVNRSSSEVYQFLQDAKRFVLQNRYIIDLAPLQVYHSAMMFAPTQSIVRQTFQRQVPQLWATLPKVPPIWSAEIQKLEGHDGSVHAVAFSPDGQVIASASSDRTVLLWNTATGEQRQTLKGHNSKVNAKASSPYRQLIPSASMNWPMHLYGAAMGEQREERLYDGRINTVAFSPDGQVIASASDDRTVLLWDAATGKQRETLKGHSLEVNAVAFSPDGQVIASASADRTVRLWNAVTGKRRQTLKGHDNGVNAVAFSPDGQVIASASLDGTVRLWNVATRKYRQTLKGHKDMVNAVVFSPDGQVIASASWDGTVRLWDAETGGQRGELKGHDGSVKAIAFSPDGQVIASASSDGTVRLWDAVTGEQRQERAGHGRHINAVVFSSDEQVIASASSDCAVRLWDAATGEWRQKLEWHDSWINAVASSPYGQLIGLAPIGWPVRLYDAVALGQSEELDHDGRVHKVVFSPDGQVIASASDDGTVLLWNAVTGRVIQLISNVDTFSIAFSVDGKSLHTDMGSFPLESIVSGLPADTSPRTISWSLGKQWVRNQDEDLLWLPFEYRGSCSAIQGKSLVIGQMSGAVSIFRLK